ncbi:MAG: 1-deoxy-D-xylulose-5-phosphate synthase [Planctomycetes bacterium]|nr:1-deoxy-D-xylulose-5-phosphate synthase [Planctomycetota bacterium]MCC7396126.1 1-deoxy-D-xylulose-5-phosphate synthase [Planctomycetota bacterium]
MFDQVNNPDDLKKIPREQLTALCAELRRVILDTVSITGGHLGSGMGVVELTVALHYVFDFADDRLVWDVGHQCYPHKLLTERKERFHTLRQKGGLSGFSNKWESKYDAYLMGHAGTAASAALGIAMGDRMQGRQRHAVAVVGDAAMGCGVAFEALNHAGSLEHERLLVILNDNRWSIAKTVGALSRYLNKLRAGPFYQRAKDTMHALIQSIPLVGKDLDQRLGDAVDMLKNMVSPGHLFEALGFRYFGPVDGHDVGQVLEALESIKKLDGVVLLHVLTEKGKGVPGSEDRYDRAHAAKPQPVKKKAEKVPVEPCVLQPVVPLQKPGRTWTEWFGDGLRTLAKKDPRLIAITAAMPDGTGLMEFRDEFPERFVDAGIAEQHAVALASGLATSGMRPVCAIYSTFLQRGYDQVFQEVILQRLPVVFAMDRAGLVGEDGATHNGLYDIAYLRCMPGLVLMAPKDGVELHEMLAFSLTLDAPSGIRYPRGNAPAPNELLGWHGRHQPLQLGRMEVLREGNDGAVLAYGLMVQTALEAASLLDKRGVHIEVVNARFCKPLDEQGVLALCDRHDRVVTLEDHVRAGGFGSAVLECLAANGPVRAQVQVMGVPDEILDHMSRHQILEHCGLTAAHVAERFLVGRDASVSR